MIIAIIQFRNLSSAVRRCGAQPGGCGAGAVYGPAAQAQPLPWLDGGPAVRLRGGTPRLALAFAPENNRHKEAVAEERTVGWSAEQFRVVCQEPCECNRAG